MNRDIFEGKWEEVRGTMKKAWGKLTDDDLDEIEGNHQILYGKLQQRYGYTLDEVRKAISDFQKKHYH